MEIRRGLRAVTLAVVVRVRDGARREGEEIVQVDMDRDET